MLEALNAERATERVALWSSVAGILLAALLVHTGIYGVVVRLIQGRRHEIGVRLVAVDESVQDGARALVLAMGKSSTLVITLDRPGTIRCDMYSQYSDGSGRSNMVRSYTFNRSPIQPKRR